MAEQQGDELGTQGFQGDENDPFLLSKAEWYGLQRYVTNALQLPIKEPQMRTAFHMPTDLDFGEFMPLLRGYQTIYPHVAKWRDAIFPATVDLAADLVHYNTAVPEYYGAFKDAIDAARRNPEDPDAKETLQAILDDRAQVAQGYANKAAAVYADIKQFANDTASDHALLSGLAPVYEDKFGASSQQAQDLKKEIDAQESVVHSANQEYDHAVIVAGTSPTYAWFFPYGTIAAVVVAGIFGDMAVKALERAKAAQQEIKKLGAECQMYADLIGAMQMARQSLSYIQKDIDRALPTIQHFQGVWNAISTDLGRLSTLVAEGIQEARPELQKLKVNEAIAQWAAVAKKADAYRAHAFIKPPAEMPLAA